MTCPIKPPALKEPMCQPPPLIRQNRGDQLYQNVLGAYGQGKRENYSTAAPYYNRFSDDNTKLNAMEPFGSKGKCLEGVKMATSHRCSSNYLQCHNGKYETKGCTMGRFFDPRTLSCLERSKIPSCR
jgi:hypothetical protein